MSRALTTAHCMRVSPSLLCCVLSCRRAAAGIAYLDTFEYLNTAEYMPVWVFSQVGVSATRPTDATHISVLPALPLFLVGKLHCCAVCVAQPLVQHAQLRPADTISTADPPCTVITSNAYRRSDLCIGCTPSFKLRILQLPAKHRLCVGILSPVQTDVDLAGSCEPMIQCSSLCAGSLSNVTVILRTVVVNMIQHLVGIKACPSTSHHACFTVSNQFSCFKLPSKALLLTQSCWNGDIQLVAETITHGVSCSDTASVVRQSDR
jgi:hypothetical protein